MAISKTTDATIIAIHQVNNKTEIIQPNNHADIVTEQIINAGIVRPVLIAQDWDTYLANAEHHDKIKNNRQQNSNVKQNTRNFNQDRNATSSQQQNTLN